MENETNEYSDLNRLQVPIIHFRFPSLPFPFPPFSLFSRTRPPLSLHHLSKKNQKKRKRKRKRKKEKDSMGISFLGFFGKGKRAKGNGG